jgi:hypothetical protein
MNRPTVKLIGTDGNAFALLGRCQSAARKAGWDKTQIDKFMAEATAGDYDNLLGIINTYFEVL